MTGCKLGQPYRNVVLLFTVRQNLKLVGMLAISFFNKFPEKYVLVGLDIFSTV